MTGAPHPADRAALLGFLERLADNGGRVPCRTAAPDDAGAWVSDDQAEQARAAVLCVGCAGVRGCDAYGLAWPNEAGVYGGRTEWERRPVARKESA